MKRSSCCVISLVMWMVGFRKLDVIISVTHTDGFWVAWYTHQTYKGATMVGSKWRKVSKFVPPDTLNMLSLALSVLRFLCKTFSGLLKFSLQKTLSWRIFKNFLYSEKKNLMAIRLWELRNDSDLKRCCKY